MRRQIVTFHGIGPRPSHVQDAEWHYWLDISQFEAALDVIKQHPDVKITFDDGNASDKAIAVPALQRRGLVAEFFVCSERIDRPGYLSSDEIRTMASWGFRFGSHGHQHVPWMQVPMSELVGQLSSSKEILQQVLGSPITSAACPFGSYGRKVVKALKQTGFSCAYTSDGGLAGTGYLQARLSITRDMTPDDVASLLRTPPSAARQLILDCKSMIKSRL